MADVTIGGLPNIADVTDDTLIPVEQNGVAQHITGRQFRAFGESTSEAYVGTAKEAAEAAKAASKAALDSELGASASAVDAAYEAQKAEKAKQAIENLSASGENADTGEEVSVQKQILEDGSVNFHFTLPPGPQGPQGIQGPQGDAGPAGPQGDTPQRGVDYYTEADKEEIVESVLTAIGCPVWGLVGADNTIILSGDLADGTYTVKYEMEDGNTVNIGSLVLSGSEPEPTYTNLADPTSADWVVGKRFNSSGALVDVDSGVNGATTNYIGGDLVAGDIIRVKNMDLTTYRVAVYDSAKTFKITTPLNNSALASTVENVTVNTTEASFTVKAGSHLTSGGYIRFCGPLTGTSEDVIITKNEEIV